MRCVSSPYLCPGEPIVFLTMIAIVTYWLAALARPNAAAPAVGLRAVVAVAGSDVLAGEFLVQLVDRQCGVG